MRSGITARLGLIVLAAALGISCGGEVPSSDSGGMAGTPGRLVIIGGGLQAENTAVYQAILDGRDGEGPICVFPTASAEPQESMESAVSRIDAVGGPGTAVGVYLTVDNPQDAALPANVQTIRSCSGFYFSGGSQSRIVRVFRPDAGDSPAFETLWNRFQQGAVVSGSSAGAAIMSDPMIGGGDSEGALQAGVRWEEDGEGVFLMKGLGFLANPLIDQHSLARGRWLRMLTAVLDREVYSFGTGIDENTALVVEAGTATVVGEAGVAFFDTRAATAPATGEGVSGVTVFLLGPGDRFDLQTGSVTFNQEKPLVDPRAGPSEGLGDLADLDLFGRWELLQLFAITTLSPESDFVLSQEGFDFRFQKGEGFEARAWEGLGPGGTSRGLSAGPYEFSYAEATEN